jgi:hypothetical protein
MSITLDKLVTPKGAAFTYPDNGEEAGSIVRAAGHKHHAQPVWGSAREFRSFEAATMYVTALAIERRLAIGIRRKVA